MLIFARTILLCVFAPWLIQFLSIIWGKGIVGLPFALGVGLMGLWWTPLPRPLRIAAAIIYLPLAAFVLFSYSLDIVCDYNGCERLPDGTPAP